MASREVDAIVAYLDSWDLPYRVTSKFRQNPPGRRSYHGAKGTAGDGLAVDFAGVAGGVTPSTMAQMVAIYNAFRLAGPQLAELIYNAPGISKAIHDGRLVDGLAVYGPNVWADHRDHVHVAVPRGIFLAPRPRAAGSGPPTVTAAAYPGGEEMLIRHDVTIPALDSQGRGWVQLDLDPYRVVSVVVNGPYPPVDGYWTIPTVSRQDRGGKTIVSLVDGHPNGHVLLSVWALG